METKSSIDTQVSTKELLVKTFGFFKLLFTKWKIWCSALLLGAIAGLIHDYFVDEEFNYRGVIIFNLELGGSTQMSQFGGLASTLGLMGSQGASSGELFTSQNFPTIVRSRAVIERALMKEVEVDGDTLLMINYVADSSDIAEKEWGGDLFHKPFTAAINYTFEKKEPKDFTILENQIINTIYEKLRDATYLDLAKGTNSIMVLSALLSDEKLTKKWVETVLETTEEFYVEMKTKKTRELLKIQEKRLKKLEQDLLSTDSRTAQLALQNPNFIDPLGRMQETQANRKSNFLSNQYVTQLATIEGLERVILEQTPIFTIVEETRLPLEKDFNREGLDVKLASLAALVLTILTLVIVDAYKQIMKP
ncbi:hypothetical protein [Jiulongibacter sediminis]|uniref:Polysaccharide chain length determinant N-terminal domain-containing protein n=1 Tax=Jiulongibacter sediminis TaxID=1605367 RepID=A0A0N8HAD1_9BACT|nr:hypothetical protein [Jiulongibacter sediminis]KPM49836.1 hypothetical protein AFM12_04480 [Jiulongibacter sediminis]TBX26872.1 hypothetical protein TK44_04485 [Jiulongibacter sediminis]